MILKTVLLIAMPGGAELVIICLAILLMVGGKKIPELVKGIGKGVKDFNAAKTNIKKELDITKDLDLKD